MKTIVWCFIFLYFVSFCNGQKIENIEVGYGVSFVTPSRGLSHSVIVGSDFIETKAGKIRIEASYLHGGPYWITAYSNSSKALRDITDPSKLRIFNLGAKFRKTLFQFNNAELYIGSGLLGSYGLIETRKFIHTELSPEELAAIQMSGIGATASGGISTTSVSEGSIMFRPVIPLNIGFVSEIGKVRFTYGVFNYFYFSKYQNIGFNLLLGLK